MEPLAENHQMDNQSVHHHEDHHNDQEKIEKMMTMTVSAAKGIVPVGQVALPIGQISQSELAPPDARELAKAFVRILQGERDPVALVETLTPEYAEVVWETLDQIEAPLPEEDEEEEDREAITFEQLIEKVAEACSGEVMLWQRLWDFTEELIEDETIDPNVRTLGSVLRRILAGERQHYLLDDLSSEHRWAVEQLLDWLNAQAVTPDMPNDPQVGGEDAVLSET